jgi:hypothetical protein
VVDGYPVSHENNPKSLHLKDMDLARSRLVATIIQSFDLNAQHDDDSFTVSLSNVGTSLAIRPDAAASITASAFKRHGTRPAAPRTAPSNWHGNRLTELRGHAGAGLAYAARGAFTRARRYAESWQVDDITRYRSSC